MGMCSYVIGFKPPDSKWRDMKKVYDVCTEAGVSVPREVERFFDDEPPSPEGVKVELDPCVVTKFSADATDYFDVDLEKLKAFDPTIKIVRFVSSY